ncbi:alpha/beta fold hydrolase [Streptomyces sp. ISL-11]|uniref:alpha/beta fold hydrolase n=1 Tax=Streptomyces sp. ISL-11 TaxID=2819174 RepID=UPI001BE8F4C2|nr:alpha/beta fold hydrolase [Streptomyces sp. ISL-11]
MSGTQHSRQPAVRKHWLHVQGVRTHYLEAGQGPATLLVHGDGGAADGWLGVMRGLAGTRRVIAVELPGYGLTQPIGCLEPAVTANFLWKFAKAVGLRRPTVVGHSLGGAIAVHMALQHPDRVPELVLVSSVGMGRAINPVQILQAATPLGELSLFASRLPFGPQLLTAWAAAEGSWNPRRLPASWWRAQTKAASSHRALNTALRAGRIVTGPLGQRHPLLDQLHKLPMPTLVVWGAEDQLLPSWQAKAALRHLRHGHLAVFPRCGHLVPIEAAGRLLKALRSFLAHAEAERTRHCRTVSR